MQYLKVRIAIDLNESATRYTYKLDGEGYMKGMAGKVFELNIDEATFRRRNDSIGIYCEKADRKFIFSKKDLRIVSDEPLPPLPEPEMFNPQLLDM